MDDASEGERIENKDPATRVKGYMQAVKKSIVVGTSVGLDWGVPFRSGLSVYFLDGVAGGDGSIISCGA